MKPLDIIKKTKTFYRAIITGLIATFVYAVLVISFSQTFSYQLGNQYLQIALLLIAVITYDRFERKPHSLIFLKGLLVVLIFGTQSNKLLWVIFPRSEVQPFHKYLWFIVNNNQTLIIGLLILITKFAITSGLKKLKKK